MIFKKHFQQLTLYVAGCAFAFCNIVFYINISVFPLFNTTL